MNTEDRVSLDRISIRILLIRMEGALRDIVDSALEPPFTSEEEVRRQLVSAAQSLLLDSMNGSAIKEYLMKDRGPNFEIAITTSHGDIMTINVRYKQKDSRMGLFKYLYYRLAGRTKGRVRTSPN